VLDRVLNCKIRKPWTFDHRRAAPDHIDWTKARTDDSDVSKHCSVTVLTPAQDQSPNVVSATLLPVAESATNSLNNEMSTSLVIR